MKHFEAPAAPRMMTDTELQQFFGISAAALKKLRADPRFPRKDGIINKTDRRAVDTYFDIRAGLNNPSMVGKAADGKENFT